MSGYYTRRAGLAAALAGAMLVLVIGAPATAYEPPSGTIEYAIEHSKYGKIGTHSVAFSRSGEDLIANVVIHIKVKLLFVTVHRVESERREVWRGGRLVGYRARTDENGDLFNVSARMEGVKLAIMGPEGTAQASGVVFPTHPWNPDIVRQTQLMDTKTGALLKVSVAAAGEEDVPVAGKTVKTSKFAISGDMERELWFDADGNLMRFRFQRDGATITFTRATPMP